MDNKNVVIFSSGVSEKKGLTDGIKVNLESRGYKCVDWRGFFSCAKHSDSIALLPMLIKKIPTFDFAVLICEGHDVTCISRADKTETVNTMRDNVLFEIGLCAMAIGLNRTILVTDSQVRLPDDLYGKNGQLAIKQFCMGSVEDGAVADIDSVCNGIDRYIMEEGDNLNQIVIGAAASGACGYAANFVCRTLEHIDDEIEFSNGEKKQVRKVPLSNVYMHIILPNNLDPNVLKDIREKQASLQKGRVLAARSRPADFTCYFEGEDLHIVDYPTNVVTSYDTARTILEMDADDSFDTGAAERFVSKEMSLFESTLRTILKEDFVCRVIDEHYCGASKAQKDQMLQNVMSIISNRLTVTRY